MNPADRIDYPNPGIPEQGAEPSSSGNVFPVPEGVPEVIPDLAPPSNRMASIGGALRELIETILLTLVIFFMIRFAVENYRIEGYSMEPNFHDGQFLLVNKLVYLIHHPQRGDVIIFHYPLNLTKNYIKRVVGLPGEKVQVMQGRIYINEVPMDEQFPYNKADYDWGPTTVPPDEYFVLGDNRPESSDSHSWGFVPAKDIVGKAWVSYWPPQYWGPIPEYSYAAAP